MAYLFKLSNRLIFDKGNNKITELRTILQRESQNSSLYKQTKSVNNRKTVKTVERHLPTMALDAYGIGFVEETCTTRDQYYGCITTVSDRNCFTRIRSNSLGS